MPDSDDRARRRQERMRRRTKKLDGFFAFSDQGGPADTAGARYTRGEAEQRASTLLSSMTAFPAMVTEASKPSGPATTGLESAIDVDPHLASLVLAAGGSGFFRREGPPPTNLAQLIGRVGTAAFRNITFTATFHGLFSKPLPWYGYGPHGLWWHLVGTAVAAWKVGEALGLHPVARELVFLAALLHDIGKPTIQGLIGDDAGAPSAASTGSRPTVLEAEVRAVNMTHAELVPLMLDIWGVEHSVFPVAEHHHAPQRAGPQARQASVIQLADLLAVEAQLGLDRPCTFAKPEIARVAEKLNVAPAAWKAIKGELGWAVAELATEIGSIGD